MERLDSARFDHMRAAFLLMIKSLNKSIYSLLIDYVGCTELLVRLRNKIAPPREEPILVEAQPACPSTISILDTELFPQQSVPKTTSDTTGVLFSVMVIRI